MFMCFFNCIILYYSQIVFISGSKGLGHVIKRGHIFLHFQALKPDIFFLQGMHISVNEQCRQTANWISQIFQAPLTCKTRGVALLFHKNIQFFLDSMKADPYGRYLMISGHWNSLPIVMQNIYGPNIANHDFFLKAFDMTPVSSSNVFIGGD